MGRLIATTIQLILISDEKSNRKSSWMITAKNQNASYRKEDRGDCTEGKS
jgi:hypothetical protein